MKPKQYLANLKFKEILPALLGLIAMIPAFNLSLEVYQFTQLENFYNEKISTFEQSEYNLYALEPGQDQRAELLDYEGVTKVFVFYRYTTSLSFGNKTIQTNGVFTNDLRDIEISQFNDNRSLRKLTTQPTQAIRLDRLSAAELGVDLGDNVNVSFLFGGNLTYQVSEIFKEDIFYSNNLTGVSFIDYTTPLQTLLTNNLGDAIKYGGAYLQSTNVAATKTALELTYKPLGQLLPRSNFPTQSAYDNYVAQFMAEQYPLASYTKNRLLDNRLVNINIDLPSEQSLVVNTVTISALTSFLIITILSSIVIYGLKFIFTYKDSSPLYFFRRQYLKFFIVFLMMFYLSLGFLGLQTFYQNFDLVLAAFFFFPLIIIFPSLVTFILPMVYQLNLSLIKQKHSGPDQDAQVQKLESVPPKKEPNLDKIATENNENQSQDGNHINTDTHDAPSSKKDSLDETSKDKPNK